MSLNKLRCELTKHIETMYENLKLLIHPSIKDYDLLNRVEDDIKLLPEIKSTIDNVDIKFYTYDYNEKIYSKDELLTFIFASINQEWNIIKGIDIKTGKSHFWLKHDDIIYDPSLAIITKQEIYLKTYKQLKEIKNENVNNYLNEYNNLNKFYNRQIFWKFNLGKHKTFSVDYINMIVKEFNENINNQYILNEEKIKYIKKYFSNNKFLEFRQVLTQKRISYLKSNKIAVHPSIDESILDIIEKAAKNIKELMEKEYNIHADYHDRTLGNCYALSILFNLYNGDFKLAQGGIPHKRKMLYGERNEFYQHSWLEKDGIVYDPALRIVTPKELYYMFVYKQDEYSKEDTENIIRKIGFNLTHFRDFIEGKQIGTNETIWYRKLVNKIDSPEMKEEGEKLLSHVKKLKR